MVVALRTLSRVLPFRWALRAFLFLTPQGRAFRRASWLVAPIALWLTRKR